MTRTTKRLIVLFVPFVLGFLCGFLVRGCSRCKAPVVETIAEVPAVPEITETPEPPAVPAVAEQEQLPPVCESDAADNSDSYEEPQAREVIYNRSRLPYAKMFADLNDAHLDVAKRVGLKTIPDKRESVSATNGLVVISDNEYYVVDNLRYSMPYLTTGAASELLAIGRAFSDSLKSKKLLEYKLVVSSVLRTEEDIRKLRRSGNPNATDNSAHCYGTTFDITYTRYFREDETEAFMQPFELTKVLGEVLRDQKNAGRCLVKYERKEHCFHITSSI